MPTNHQLPAGKPLLAVAHPGHELRVYHWMKLDRPDVLVLTDGSGHVGKPRLDRTTRLLTGVSARATDFYGCLSDLHLYNATLEGDVDFFVDLVRQMADVLERGSYDYVVGDAAEGAILGHDIFRAMLDAAIALTRAASGRSILNLDFPLEGEPGSCHPALFSEAYPFTLDDDALDRKIAAGMAYTELVHEVEAALAHFGREAFAVEVLRPAITASPYAPFDGLPGYETHGMEVVSEGRYQQVVRYEQHVLPLLTALRAALCLPFGWQPAAV